MSAPFFFFRPILAADRSWVALDWQPSESLSIESAARLKCFSESAAGPLANLLPFVAIVSPAHLGHNEFFEAFDPSQAVFVLPVEVLANTQALDRCKQLRGRGYRIALKLDSSDILRQVPLAAFDYLQFDATFARQELSAIDLIYVKDAGFHKIVTDVSSYEMFGWLAEKNFDWCDSHFLTKRNPHAGKEPDLTRLKLLKLLNIVRQDGDTREIEAIFREEPKLSYNLLRLVNSVAVGARTKISSFSQAIAILGRRQLQRWLQLLIYANNLADGNIPNPLMQIAAARGRQMEILSAAIEPIPDIPDLSDNAFMTGLFSLLDVLINMPMTEILKELPMQDEVSEALSSPGNGGTLGHLLSAIVAGESGNFATAETLFSELGISPSVHAKAQVTALYWAARINIESHD